VVIQSADRPSSTKRPSPNWPKHHQTTCRLREKPVAFAKPRRFSIPHKKPSAELRRSPTLPILTTPGDPRRCVHPRLHTAVASSWRNAFGLYETIEHPILSPRRRRWLCSSRCDCSSPSTNRARIVASARVFAATRNCKSQPPNDLRGGRKTRPGKTQKSSSPSTNCRSSSEYHPTKRREATHNSQTTLFANLEL